MIGSNQSGVCRRGFVAGSTALAAGLGLPGCMTTNAVVAERPNILVFVADDAGAREFGIYGNNGIATPHLDRLGRSGLVADAAILTTPQCSPSRISILSGLEPHATKAEDLHMPAPEGLEMVQGILSGSGYFTGGLHKMHLGPAGERQFDWYDNNLNALPGFLSAAGDRPFFMWVGFTDPHRPYERRETPQLNDPSKVTVPPWLVDDSETRRDLADYYNEITRMDAQIAQMLGAIELAGKLGNTLVLFISDNGAPFPRAKGTLYDAGIQTPFLVSWPGRIAPGTRHNRLISVIDLAPTFLDLARVKVPVSMQGQSMAGGLLDPSRLNRTHAFSSRNWHNTDEHMRSARTERYKLITNAYTERPMGAARDIGRSPSFQSLVSAREAGVLDDLQSRLFEAPRPAVELYDLKSDPLELNNLADDPALTSVRADLLASLADWRRRTGDHEPVQRRRGENVDRLSGQSVPGVARLPDWMD